MLMQAYLFLHLMHPVKMQQFPCHTSYFHKCTLNTVFNMVCTIGDINDGDSAGDGSCFLTDDF